MPAAITALMTYQCTIDILNAQDFKYSYSILLFLFIIIIILIILPSCIVAMYNIYSCKYVNIYFIVSVCVVGMNKVFYLSIYLSSQLLCSIKST